MVWFVFREDYYIDLKRPQQPSNDGSSSPELTETYAKWEQEYLAARGEATLIVAKQRHGSTGNVPLHFHSEFTKFTSPNVKDYSDWGYE